MPTDTTVNNLVINKLTKAQYDAIQNPSDTELYLVPDVIDTTPTSGSDNMVTSGGVYDALSNKAATSDIPIVPTALSSFTDDLGSSPTHTHSQYLTSHQDISVKADKVSNATNGHLAGLDANGNLTDSGFKIVVVDEATYESLTKDSNTIYLITEE